MPTDLPLPRLDFVALDLEATGCAHGHDRIVELGAARFRIDADGRVTPGPVFSALVDPQLAIPEVVSRLTGIDDAMVAGAPKLDALWSDFMAFVAPAPTTIVLAHSARSDLAYLVSEAARLDLELPDALSLYCTLRAARASLTGAPKYGLAALAGYVASQESDTGHQKRSRGFHRALDDALHTRNLFAHCVRAREARTLRDVGLAAAVRRPAADEFVVEVPERLAPLTAAIRLRERVAMVYRGGSKGRGSRIVTPLAFFADRGVPYLRAWCHMDDAAKSFRCDRIAAVRPGPVPEPGVSSGAGPR